MVKVTDIKFDIINLHNQVVDILNKQPALAKDSTPSYLGIGLHYYDDKNPYYDCLNYLKKTQPGLIYTKPNEYGKQFKFVYDLFQNLSFTRGRILIAKAGHKGNNHTDEQTAFRLHIPIITNEKCLMNFSDKSYHMPADGSAYITNTKKPHSFENMGNNDRIHLVFTVKVVNHRQL